MKKPQYYAGEVINKSHINDVVDIIKEAQAEAYAAGQKRGHEDAVSVVLTCMARDRDAMADAIRNLPIKPVPTEGV
jgi:hypothetical protein